MHAILSDNPYAPPTEAGATAPPAVIGPTLPTPVLVSLCFAIAVITWASTSTGVPEVYSPFPLLVILPAFFGIPIPLIAIGSAGLFGVSLLRHFQGTPAPRPNRGLTVVLAMITGLTALSIIGGWSYGVEYQGANHTIAVTIANLIFAAIAWSTWTRARIPGRSRMQVAFSFTLFAWMFWYALPYLGELP